MRARYDPEFNDVKKREKHFYCRCPTCAKLCTLIGRASDNKAERQKYDQLLKEHHYEVKKWRAFEAGLHMASRHSPEKLTVLGFDDTSAIGFPRMTNRPIKSMLHGAIQSN